MRYEHGDDDANIVNDITISVDDIFDLFNRLINMINQIVNKSDEIISNFNQFAGSHNCTPLFVLCRHVACRLQVSGHEHVAHWVP